MPDLDLELALVGLGRRLSYPPTPDLVSSVSRRLEASQRPRRSPARMLVLAFALLLATAAIAAAVTAGLHGLGIVFVHKLPPVRPARSLDLGLQVQKREVDRVAGFRVVMPGPPLGTPDAWFVGNIGSGASRERVVTLVWGSHAGLPPLRHGVSVLVTETPGRVEPGFAQKFIGPGSHVDPEAVNGAPGIWVHGAPHVLAWSDGGAFQHQNLRLVGNVLAWNHGALLLRIEGARTLGEARRLAASFG